MHRNQYHAAEWHLCVAASEHLPSRSKLVTTPRSASCVGFAPPRHRYCADVVRTGAYRSCRRLTPARGTRALRLCQASASARSALRLLLPIHRPSELRNGTSGTSATLRSEAFHCPTTGPLHEHASRGHSDIPPTGLRPLWGRGDILLWVRKAWRHQRVACSTHRAVAVCAAPEPRAAVVDE